jgi:hypothetical protein
VSVVDVLGFRIALSLEGPGHFKQLRRDGWFSWLARPFDAYAVPSFNAEVPNPWLTNLSQIYTDPAGEESENVASFIAANCRSLNNREQWVREIQSVFPVAALGTCMNNAPGGARPRAKDWHADKVGLMKRYRFHLAFENQNEDHMTEKLWYALEAGTLPVYLGDRNAQRWAPPRSFIDAHQFSDGVELGKFLLRLSQDRLLYDSYHAWRRLAPPEHLVRLFAPITKHHIKCRICLWARDRRLQSRFWPWSEVSMRLIRPSRAETGGGVTATAPFFVPCVGSVYFLSRTSSTGTVARTHQSFPLGIRGLIDVTAAPGALAVDVPCNSLAQLCLPRSAHDGALLTPRTTRLLLDGDEVPSAVRGGHLCASRALGCGQGGAPRRLTVL